MSTATALLQSQPGANVAGAWPQVTPNGVASQNLDLIQIVDNNGLSVLCNVDSTGAVHTPAVSPTNGTRIGQFVSRLSSSATTAQLFADAFTNPSQLDIIQVIVPNSGSVHYSLSYQGVASGS